MNASLFAATILFNATRAYARSPLTVPFSWISPHRKLPVSLTRNSVSYVLVPTRGIARESWLRTDYNYRWFPVSRAWGFKDFTKWFVALLN